MARQAEPAVAVTLLDVARKAGVSTATVSRALRGGAPTSDSTRARVIAVAQELGYSPPRQPKRRTDARHEAQGLVLAELAESSFSELVIGHESAAAALGQSVVLVVTRRGDDASEAVRDLAKRVDGLAIGANTVPDAVAHSLSRGLPVVLVARGEVAGCDSVRAENVESATMLTSHLLGHGRSRLVFVGDPDASPDLSERYAGFRNAHVEAGVPLRRPPLRVPVLEGAGIQVAEEILRRRVKIDGLVCGSDILALAIMKRLQDNGVRIPDDLAITGWGDLLAARYIAPALSTVRQPIRELGRRTATLLHSRVLGERPVGGVEVLPSQIILRTSCGCPALAVSTSA